MLKMALEVQFLPYAHAPNPQTIIVHLFTEFSFVYEFGKDEKFSCSK